MFSWPSMTRTSDKEEWVRVNSRNACCITCSTPVKHHLITTLASVVQDLVARAMQHIGSCLQQNPQVTYTATDQGDSWFYQAVDPE